MNKVRVLITSSSRDREWPRRLAMSLRENGIEARIDEPGVRPGAALASAIKRGVERSSHVVTIIDPKSENSANALFEAGVALGLGKLVTFVIPESKAKLRSELKIKNFVYRGTPDATAKGIAVRVMPSQRLPEKPVRPASRARRPARGPEKVARAARR